MKSDLVEAALQVVRSQQILVNLVSRRVRQLSLGARPMVESVPSLRDGHADVALREIAAGKLTFERTGGQDGELASDVVEFPGVIVPKKPTKKKAA
jgi:DNA-directed RNA polymerase subunit omega